MFAGSLKQMDLSEVLKLLTASHQTGVLNLMDTRSGHAVAMIYLQVGQMVHAQSGATSGLDAISDCCRLGDEAFAFEENMVAPQQTLAAYPTAKLLEKMTGQISEAKALRLAMPKETDVPVYLPGASLAGLDATADDLSLLILCNGARTVSDLAKDSRRSLADAAQAIAKFRKAGIVELSFPAATSSATYSPPPAPQGMTSPESLPSPSATATSHKQTKYWRGKLIEE
jgi:hypothetical protein